MRGKCGRIAIVLVACFAVLSHCEAQSFQRLRELLIPDQAGTDIRPPLLSGPSGVLYGLNARGGVAGRGTIFGFNPHTLQYSNLWHFGLTNPVRQLLMATPDGDLFGFTEPQDGMKAGGLFRVKNNVVDFTILHTFNGSISDAPIDGSLALNGDGFLYGCYEKSWGPGIAFRIRADGTEYRVLHEFGVGAGDGVRPMSVVIGRDGFLYGSTYGGGLNSKGTIFRMLPNGDRYEVTHNFKGDALDGMGPGRLVVVPGGAIFGTSSLSVRGQGGFVFEVNTNVGGILLRQALKRTVQDGVRFPAMSPVTEALIPGDDGYLYGVTGGEFQDAGTFYRLLPSGADFKVLYRFATDNLTGSGGGNLWAVVDGTVFGASDGDRLFAWKPDRGVTLQRKFLDNGGAGVGVSAPLLVGIDNKLYGVTGGGGGFGTNNGAGTLFRLNRDGSEFTVLHRFLFSVEDGMAPANQLVQGRDETLYGTTIDNFSSYGTIFRSSPDGSHYSIIHRFAKDHQPTSGLTMDDGGWLYGALRGAPPMGGALFRMQTNGQGFAFVIEFGNLDKLPGAVPSLVFNRHDGFLYGATSEGYNFHGGLLFRLKPTGEEFSVLYTFPLIFPWDAMARLSPQLFIGKNGEVFVTASDKQNGNALLYILRPGDREISSVGTVSDRGIGPVEDADGELLELFGFFQSPTAHIEPAISYTPIQLPWDAQLQLGSLEGPVVPDLEGAFYGVSRGYFETIYRFVPNRSPLVKAGPIEINCFCGAGVHAALPNDVFDEADANQTITYSISGVPDWLTFNPISLTLSGIPTSFGTTIARLTATDNGRPVKSASVNVRITVEPVANQLVICHPQFDRIAQRLSLSASGTPGASYQLQKTHDVSAPIQWVDEGAATSADPSGILVFANIESGNASFFRVISVPR